MKRPYKVFETACNDCRAPVCRQARFHPDASSGQVLAKKNKK